MTNNNIKEVEGPKLSVSSVDDGIDLIKLGKALWEGRITLIIFLVVFIILGVFVARFSPVEYKAQTIMVPQTQTKSSGLGGLGSLAALAGFNLDAMQGGSAELSPMVYPQIVKSLPFQRVIMHTPITWEGLANPVSLLYYYDSLSKPNPLEIIKKYTIGLPGVLLKAIKGDKKKSGDQAVNLASVVSLSGKEIGMRGLLSKNLFLEVNTREGFITLTAIAPEALAAAQIAEKAQKLLREQITDFRIDKARQNLRFIEALYKEKETAFIDAQARLAGFRDSNLNLGSAMAKTGEEKLQSEYQLAFSVYNEVAKQLENAKIKEKEETPVFSIIEPVSVPFRKSKPQMARILMIWVFLGGMIGTGWVLGKHYLPGIRKMWTGKK